LNSTFIRFDAKIFNKSLHFIIVAGINVQAGCQKQRETTRHNIICSRQTKTTSVKNSGISRIHKVLMGFSLLIRHECPHSADAEAVWLHFAELVFENG
jgi:hypothetical protein